MEQKSNVEVFTFGALKLIKLGPKGRQTITKPAIEIEIWQQGANWHWSLNAMTRTGGLYTGSTGISSPLFCRQEAVIRACSALTRFGNEPLIMKHQARLPKGWERWLFLTFGDSSQQLGLFGKDELGQLALF